MCAQRNERLLPCFAMLMHEHHDTGSMSAAFHHRGGKVTPWRTSQEFR